MASSDAPIPGHILTRLIKNKLATATDAAQTSTKQRTVEDAFGRLQIDNQDQANEGPMLYACARHTVKAWRQQQEKTWSEQIAKHEVAEEVAAEHERLTHVFMGDEGLDPRAWPRLLHKLEVLADHNVRRQYSLEKHRLSLHQWDTQPQLKAALQCVQQAAKSGRQLVAPHQTSKKDATSEHRVPVLRQPTSSKVEHAKGMAYEELAASIMQRMRAMGVHAGTLLPQDLVFRDVGTQDEDDPAGDDRILTRHETEIRYDDQLTSGLVTDMKGFSKKTFNAHKFVAQVSRVAASSTSAAQALSARLADAEHDGHDDQPDDGTQDAGAAADSKIKQRPSFTGSGASAASGACSMFSMATKVKRLSNMSSSLAAASRRQSQARNKKVVVSELVQAYYDACAERGVYVSPDVSQQLHISESSNEIKIAGVAMPDLVAASIADVLGRCTNLKTINFSRTVLNAGALAHLLPASRQLRLTTLQLIITDMPADCWPHLLEALQRPTISLSHPPSQWWRTLRNVSLSGNPLGDQGLACLSPAIIDLQVLCQLDLSQTGITDWSAPQVEGLIRGCRHLQHLCLAHNQLGALTGKALAGALPAASQLQHLDLSWNPLGGGVALLAWSLLAPRSQRQSQLSELLLCGVEMQRDDHLALAALLKWGHTWLRLTKLDISHNNLVGVSAQCLMRQLDALLPYANKPLPAADLPDVEPSLLADQPGASLDGSKPQLNMKENSGVTAESSRVSSLHRREAIAHVLVSQLSRKVGHTPSAESVRGLWSRPSTAHLESSSGMQDDSKGRKPSLYGARAGAIVDPGHPAQPKRLTGTGRQSKPELAIVAMGCRVDNQGAGSSQSSRPAGSKVLQKQALSTSEDQDAAREACTPGAERFEFNLAVQRPDHFLAQLLVEHELDARRHNHINTAWQYVELDGVVYRSHGHDIVPFDVLFNGWGHPGVLPNTGSLVLDVKPLSDNDSAWLMNPRLHFNAKRLAGL